MRLCLMLPAKPTLQWEIASQLGVEEVITKAAPELSGLGEPSDFASLEAVVKRFRERGLRVVGLEGDEMDMSRIKLGLPGRDDDLERYCRMLENMGRLGIEMICYNFMAGVGWYRSRNDLPERGGALTSGFDLREIDNSATPVLSEEQLWSNYEYFIRAVMPTAERCGVRMGLHPDDPPISPLLGYPRILTSADAYRRALALSDSPSHGVTFCQATFRVMGEEVSRLIEEWGPRIFLLHFRDTTGTRTCFRETFHDNGPTDMAALIRQVRRHCPDCLIRPDHTPTMAGESNENFGYATLGNIFAVGYLRGLMEQVGD
ncbi:MAG: mannonate dehydratase [Eubacteriales bacterium]|nr:mannonate dehydratase [Eubacteriales bacterium]